VGVVDLQTIRRAVNRGQGSEARDQGLPAISGPNP
jgi:hypothetical protein